MKMTLDGKWTLECFEPECGKASFKIDAHVPGNVELDIYNAGIEPEPYYGDNEYLYHKYEACSWTFTREFTMPDYGRAELVFEGLNCIADIYIDGKPVGHTENALIAHRLPLCGVKPGETHEIKVRIASAVLHARKYDFPVHLNGCDSSDEYCVLRMPPHSFGWDIMPRFPSAGMWRSVYIEEIPPARITQVYYATLSAGEDSARIACRFRFETADPRLDGYTMRFYLDGTLAREVPARFISGNTVLTVKKPRLWWPQGYGDANLYTVRAELVKGKTVLDVLEERIGIRTAEVVHRMQANDDGEFLIRINGCPILAKGSNWVPMDAMHSRDAGRYEKAVELFRECGCNIMRMWGGNVYEDSRLFELCDENGIMVWQDFAMACATYPQNDDFAARISEEAVSVIRKLRNHPCLLLWAGDNEVDEGYSGNGFVNCYNSVTREALPRAVRENDPYRMFLPSSPYIDGGVARYDVPEQHNWGPRAYFKDDFYKQTRAHFISECGYHGCPAVDSLRKYIPENELSDMCSSSWMAHSSEYRIGFRRGYNRNLLMADQVRLMFGDVPSDIDEFCFLSQFTQAEAKKFFVERTRIKKWRRTGIIWWNMIDGWPQISDAVVDWYYVKKRAFEAIRRVQRKVCVIMDEISGWNNDVYISNDSREDFDVAYRLYDADTDETLLEGTVISKANECARIGSVEDYAGRQHLVMIKWTVGGRTYANHYLCGFPPYKAEDARRWAKYIDEAENELQ